MKKSVKEEIEFLIKKLNLNCSVEKFKDEVDWGRISSDQKLSEGFIRKFKNKVNWVWISKYQKLSENFIREFKYKIKMNRLKYKNHFDNLGIDMSDKFKPIVINKSKINYSNKIIINK
jgi:hypothetical protein